ncbi:MAG: tetratricopeptide repeat protein [Phycisphaeraceae bacterium]|nr:tetratricopeptide repeat protein [Phycisphaeraceae bacterium]
MQAPPISAAPNLGADLNQAVAAQATPTQPPPTQPTDELQSWQMAVHRLDDARAALASGQAAAARVLIERTLTEFPEEPALLRFLGVARLHEGDLPGAADAFARAHRADPSLADRPLAPGAFQRERRTIDSVLGRVAPLASRTDSADLWLVAVVLNQALGREAQAARLLDRAIETGLDVEIASALARALGR